MFSDYRINICKSLTRIHNYRYKYFFSVTPDGVEHSFRRVSYLLKPENIHSRANKINT